MNNLKRVLSLGLAGTMLTGMMMVGAGAADYKDFTDKDEIDHSEAVETLVALNVISGKDTGAFDPDGSLTRAEMAKLAVFVLHGGKDPVLGTKATPTFSDIDNHWAESYIEYCASTGIINGQGDGTFAPDATLTGSQAAKMIMTAMGYNSDVFGFTGADWEINTNVEANKAKLYDELGGMDPTTTITRDQAAQLVYNAIKAPLMIRSWSQNQTSGEVSETYRLALNDDGTISKSLLSDKFGGAIQVGYLTGYTYDEAKEQWSYTFDASANFGTGALTANNKFDTIKTLKSKADYTDLFGQQTKVIYKTSVNDVVYGVYANDSDVVVEGVAGDIGTIDASANTAKISGTVYKFNRVNAPSIVFNNNNDSANGDTVATLKDENTSFRFKAVDNNSDGKIDAIIKTPVLVAKITYVGSDSITVNAPVGLSPKVEDIEIYEDYAKNDWVIRTAAAYSATGRDTYEKAEVETGTITGTRTGEYLIDGSWYDKGTNTNVAGSLNINDTVEFVAMGGKLFYVKVTEAGTTTKDIAMVISADNGSSDLTESGAIKANLIFTDGTKKSGVKIAKVNGATATFDATAATAATTNVAARIGRLVTYKVNSDGEYELTDISSSNLAGYKGAGNATTYNNKEVGGYELADDAVVFVLTAAAQSTAANANKGKVYTGREIKNAGGTSTIPNTAGLTTVTGLSAPVASLYNMVNGFNYAKVAVMYTSVDLTITSGSNYGYLVSNAYNTYEDGKTYINYKFWNGTENVEAKEESTNSLDELKSGAVITYDNKAAGEIKNVSVVDATLATVSGWDGSKKIEFSSSTSREINSDTVVLFVNSKEKEGVVSDIGSISLGDDTDGDDVADQYNVRYVTGATYVDLLLVDTQNKMQAAPVKVLPTSATTVNINSAFASTSKVIIDGDYTIPGAIAVPQGKTLVINGVMTAASTNAVTGAGTLSVTTFADTASAALAQTNTVEVTGSDDSANLEGVPVAPNKTLIVGGASNDAASSATTWYTTTGSAPTNAPTNDNGVIGTSLAASSTIPAGTYVGSTVYTSTAGVTAIKWLKQA